MQERGTDTSHGPCPILPTGPKTYYTNPMMPIRKITVFFVFILSLAACDKTTNATHEDISQMDYAAWTEFLAHETIPAESFPRAIVRYAML